MNEMIPNNSAVERLIVEYIEQQQKSLHHHKKKTDAEKEYNKLLAISGGEDKCFSLEEAERIYKAYQDMTVNDEQSKLAESKFTESYEKLKELGQVLFYASITADVIVPPVNGGLPAQKKVKVTFPNGEVFVA
jgi:Cdc6-like AAA superfamily ATPase